MAHFLKVLFTIGVLTLGTAEKTKSPFPWKSLEAPMDMKKATAERASSFDEDMNWNICKSNVKTVSFSPHVEDYAVEINAKLKSLESTGGAVRLTKGQFPIKSAIVLPSHTCLIGNGTSETVIKIKDKSQLFEKKGAIYASKGENISLVAFTVDGNKDMQHLEKKSDALAGVYFELVNYVWFRNVASVNHSRHGFHLHGSDGRHIFHAFVKTCIAKNNIGVGFKLGSTTHASIYRSKAKGNGHSGIAVSFGASSTMLKNNIVESNGVRGKGCGIRVYNQNNLPPTNTLIVSNNITDSPHAGICLESSSGVVASGNRIMNKNSSNAHCFSVSDTYAFTESDTECDVLSRTHYFPGPCSKDSKSSLQASTSPSMSPTPSATPSASPSSSASARFPCSNGIVHHNVCCSKTCPECGGNNCKGDCCPSNIIESGRKCLDFDNPPCIL